MKKSFVASLAFHLALILSALFVLPSPAPLVVPPAQAIFVDISTISDKVKQKTATTEDVKEKKKPAPKKSDKKAEPAPKVAEEEVKAVKEPAAVEPPPPTPPKPPEPKKEEPKKEEVKKPEPKPEPKKEEVKKPEPKLEPKPEDKPLESDPLKALLKDQELDEQRAAEAVKKAEEKKKAAEAKKQAEEEKKQAEAEAKKQAEADAKKKADAKKVADAKKKKKEFDDISAFLNKEEGERAAPQESAEDGAPEKAEKASKGDDAEIAGTLIDALVTKIRDCWTVPPAARDSDATVKVQFQLDRNGAVIGNPVKVGGGNDPVAQATAAAAISAIKQCETYDLPADKYDLWKDVILDFNPNMMSRT
jgi:TolA protein